MTLKKIESIELNNGLTLTLYDASNKIAEDRWRVKLEATIEIEVVDSHFNEKAPLPAPIDQIIAKLGNKVSYAYQAERNFVDQQDKEVILGQMQASIIAKKPYYDHPNFASRYIIKEFSRCRHLPNIAQ